MNIAIFTPSQNPYSETFIQAHKDFLQGNIFYYYGESSINLEGHGPLDQSLAARFFKIFVKLFRKPSSHIRDRFVKDSLKKNRINVALVEYGNHAASILSILKSLNIPMIVHFHGYDASVISVIQEHNSYQEMFNYADKVIAVSRVMEEDLLKMGCPREKLIYNVYGPRPIFHEVIPTYAKQNFISIGRFTNKKAPYYAILAFRKVIAKFPHAKLLMAGSGELLNTCENLSKYFGLENNIEFLGVIDSDKFCEILSESVAFVQHSVIAKNGDKEGTPLAVLEASAAGLPVIATNHAGIPDVIIHEKTGLLCKEHDVDKMSEYMIRLLSDPELVRIMGMRGKLNIKENFNLERHIQLLQELLENECNIS